MNANTCQLLLNIVVMLMLFGILAFAGVIFYLVCKTDPVKPVKPIPEPKPKGNRDTAETWYHKGGSS